jgi:hypothetical protein
MVIATDLVSEDGFEPHQGVCKVLGLYKYYNAVDTARLYLCMYVV